MVQVLLVKSRIDAAVDEFQPFARLNPSLLQGQLAIAPQRPPRGVAAPRIARCQHVRDTYALSTRAAN